MGRIFFLYKVKLACCLKIDSHLKVGSRILFIWPLLLVFFAFKISHRIMGLGISDCLQIVCLVFKLYLTENKRQEINFFSPYFNRKKNAMVSKFALFSPYSKIKQVNNYKHNPQTKASKQLLILTLVYIPVFSMSWAKIFSSYIYNPCEIKSLKILKPVWNIKNLLKVFLWGGFFSSS